MKTIARLYRRLLPVPPHSQLADYIVFFNAPRIYMPSGSGDERIRNRTVPKGNCLLAGRKAPAQSKAADGGSCCH